MLFTAEDQVDHYCAMPVEGEEQPQHPVNPISHPVLLSSAPDVNFTEPIENQVSSTTTSGKFNFGQQKTQHIIKIKNSYF